ncbi:MAG: GNAT family N-acetyltransferase [Candidatus Kariarchaeaceae archaeon]|jgi:ribosomal protein S18 acetylase RimI-like enzyme
MITIRHSNTKDIPELKETVLESFTQAGIDDFGDEKILPPGVADGTLITKGFEEKTPFTIMWHNKIVGGIIIDLNENKDHYLQGLWILSEYQNKGIGKRAIKFLEDKYPDAISWHLETPEASKRNLRFYENLGYKKIGEQRFKESKVVLYNYKKDMS